MLRSEQGSLENSEASQLGKNERASVICLCETNRRSGCWAELTLASATGLLPCFLQVALDDSERKSLGEKGEGERDLSGRQNCFGLQWDLSAGQMLGIIVHRSYLAQFFTRNTPAFTELGFGKE